MLISLDNAIPGADATPEPSDVAPLNLKVNPSDAILGIAPLKEAGIAPVKEAETSSARKKKGTLGRFLRYSAGTAVVACLCGLAWTAGAHHAGHPLFDFMRTSPVAGVQQSVAQQDTDNAIRQLADQVRSLKASIEEARDASGKSGEGHDAVNAVPTAAALADLTSRVDKLETALTTQFAQVNEHLAGIEQKMSGPRTASASRARSLARHAGQHHDAFDPSRDPAAPGAPRQLGAY